ncbi:MAG: UDP-N-acetylmuramoyl-L-alanyl-D-glutamate--2,6-diaminopimelate ligase [Deltaproteobacteria bacterium]|nr:UDP-N-acetylmuramoyl-L-alanyl-D-glutamate--2,6-diaminopimelate ligase [Deltaproteobacteria bacterium]
MQLKPLNTLAKAQPTGSITLDSRKVKPGMIFVAAKGATKQSQDGHSFISQAIQNSCSGLIVETPLNMPIDIPVWQASNSRIAAAVLAEQAAGNPSEKLKLCGVTGTNGKTTVTYLLASIAEAAQKKAGVLGTLGAGSVTQPKAFGFTTPEAEDLSALIASFAKEGFEHIAMEVSSHALATHRVDGMHFAAAGFTNLSQDHLDFHGNMADYSAAKMRLFLELLPEDGVAVVPEIFSHPGAGQNPVSPWRRPGSSFMGLDAGLRQHDRVLQWGYSPKADIQASNIQESLDGTALDLRIINQTVSIRAPILGRFNIDNLLCAAGLAHATNISLDDIARGLENARLPAGRLQRVANLKPAVFVDFAHTPDALESLLKTMRELSTGRLILVFGCGGDRDRQKRPLMAQVALKNADKVFVTQDNPRYEDPDQIIADMQLPSGTTVIHDRKKAIEEAISLAKPEDTVLISGKGHETTQQIQERLLPFSDVEIAYENLLNRHKNHQTR